MKIAVFSDIHSNHLALEACFKEAEKQKADVWAFLGDYVSDCAYPHRTMELLYKAQAEHDCRFVKGNREEYMLNHRDHGSNWEYGDITGSFLYTYDQLTPEDIRFIEALPMNDVIRIPGTDPVHICHGAPYKTRVELKPKNGRLPAVLAAVEEPVLLSGHSHTPFVEYESGKMYVNPGTVGIPTTGVTQAEMAFLTWDGSRWVPQLVHVPYDVEATVREMEEAGLRELTFVWADCIIKGLRTAENYAIACLDLAAEKANGGPVEKSHLLRAAEELGIIE